MYVYPVSAERNTLLSDNDIFRAVETLSTASLRYKDVQNTLQKATRIHSNETTI